MKQTENNRTIAQRLHWGARERETASPADTVFVLAGRRVYVVGNIDGKFRSRAALPEDGDSRIENPHGVWAQPVRGISGYGFVIEDNGVSWRLEDADSFTHMMACARFEFHKGPVRAIRQDVADPGLPVVFTTLALSNMGQYALDLRIVFTVTFDLQAAWMPGFPNRAGEQIVFVEDGKLIAQAGAQSEWCAAAAGDYPPDEFCTGEGGTGEMVYHLRLVPGVEINLTFAMAVVSEGGTDAAVEALGQAIHAYEESCAGQVSRFDEPLMDGPRLVSPDDALNSAFDLACANLRLLEADSPVLGRFFYGGIGGDPNWRSGEGARSLPGMMAGGLIESALNHLRIGLRYLDGGRIPHQIAPSGRVMQAGGTQDIPLWVISLWDAYRWSGDREFLEEVYPGARQGLFDYVLGAIDADHDGYPSGPSMIDEDELGAEKVDSAAYTWAALQALAEMARVLGDQEVVEKARASSGRLAAHFDRDWWNAGTRSYAASLSHPSNGQRLFPHWAAAAPLEVGLAETARAGQAFAALRASGLNRYGLMRAAGTDERVLAAANGMLSRAAFRYRERELGLELLRPIGETTGTGSLGMFHEQVPQGGSTVSLTAAALFVRGIVEDLLGIEVHAADHILRVSPRVPANWGQAALESLRFGEHLVSVRISGGEVQVAHHQGPAPLLVETGVPGRRLQKHIEPGEEGLPG